MRVKYLRGNMNTAYTVVMPEDKSISDLPPRIQEAIGLLGDLNEIKKEDLTNRVDSFSQEIIQKIGEHGAYLLKTTVSIDEIEPGNLE